MRNLSDLTSTVIVSFYKKSNSNLLFDKNSSTNRDGSLEPYIYLKNYLYENGIFLDTVEKIKIRDAKCVIFLKFDLCKFIIAMILSKPIIYFHFEPSVVKFVNNKWTLQVLSKFIFRIYSWDDDLVDSSKIFKFYYPIPSLIQSENLDFKSRKLVTAVFGHKASLRKNELYSERLKLIRSFTDIDLFFRFFGVGWYKENLSSYGGPIQNKKKILEESKFSICFENQKNINGLISEKVFDCMYANNVPIYYGASNINNYLPNDVYIDYREFEDISELHNFILKMTEDEYNRRIESINCYLRSDDHFVFRKEYFAETVLKGILESIDIPVVKYKLINFIVVFCFGFFFIFDKLDRYFSRIIRVVK